MDCGSGVSRPCGRGECADERSESGGEREAERVGDDCDGRRVGLGVERGGIWLVVAEVWRIREGGAPMADALDAPPSSCDAPPPLLPRCGVRGERGDERSDDRERGDTEERAPPKRGEQRGERWVDSPRGETSLHNASLTERSSFVNVCLLCAARNVRCCESSCTPVRSAMARSRETSAAAASRRA